MKMLSGWRARGNRERTGKMIRGKDAVQKQREEKMEKTQERWNRGREDDRTRGRLFATSIVSQT